MKKCLFLILFFISHFFVFTYKDISAVLAEMYSLL